MSSIPDNSLPSGFQRGMVLITTLLLLVVVTLLALAMFRGVGLENRIAGNVLDKQRAVQAADSTQQYTEQWLIDNVATAPPTDCAQNPAGTNVTTVCTLPLDQQIDGGQVSTVPWRINGTQVGFPYNPGGALSINSAGGSNTIYQQPTAYVGEIGPDDNYGGAYDYRVDAWSYGGSDATVAVVESTYMIRYYVTPANNP